MASAARAVGLTGNNLIQRTVSVARRYLAAAILRLLRVVGRAKLPAIEDAPIRSIIVFRFGGIGDVTVITGLLRSLRKTYPTARISFATAPSFVPIVTGSSDVDEVLVSAQIIPYGGLHQFVTAIGILRRWSSRPFDLAIFSHNFFYMMVLALFVRARYKVGFDTNQKGFDFAMTHSVPIYGSGDAREVEHEQRHANEYFHDLLRTFSGRQMPAAAPKITVLEYEADAARASLTQRDFGERLVVIAAGGSEALKIWPVERFAAVARRAVAEHAVGIVILGGADEVRHADLFRDIKGRVWFAAGQLTLRQSIAVTSLATLVIGSDTGMVHVAAALGVPTIAIFGPTPAKVYGYGDHNHHGDHIVLYHDLPCVPCKEVQCRLLGKNAVGAVAPCLDATTVDMVCGKITAFFLRDLKDAGGY